MSFRISLTNWVSPPLATITSKTSEAGAYPATFAQHPHRPFIGWRTTATTQQDIVFNLSTNRLIEYIALANVNYTQVQFFTDNDPAFGSADWSSGTQVISINQWNERYQLGYVVPVPPTNQYLLVRILNQTPTDGASYFRTVVWAGSLTTLPGSPIGLRWGEEITTEEARRDVRTDSGGLQMLKLDNGPKTIIEYTRMAHISTTTPGTGDELAAWKLIDRQMRAAETFAWFLDRGNTSEAWIMRKTNMSRWPVNPELSEDSMVLEEAVGP